MSANENEFKCRDFCGACCIVPSISSMIPGTGKGKPAFVPCVHLTPDFKCAIFDSPDRPAICASLRPSAEMCGDSREKAIAYLSWLELETAP